MSTFIIVVLVLGAIVTPCGVIGSVVAERRHPPIGRFVDFDDVRLHYVDVRRRHRPARRGVSRQRRHDPGHRAAAGLLDRPGDAAFASICFDRPGFGHSTRPRFRLITPEVQAELFAAALQRARRARSGRDRTLLGHAGRARACAARPRSDARCAASCSPPAITSRPAVRRVDRVGSGGSGASATSCATRSRPMLGWLLAPLDDPQRCSRLTTGAAAVQGPSSRCRWRCGPGTCVPPAEELALMIPAAARLQALYRHAVLPGRAVPFATRRHHRSSPIRVRGCSGTLPRSVLHVVHDAGHMLHHAVPDEIVGAVDDTMASVRRAGARRRAAPRQPNARGCPVRERA